MSRIIDWPWQWRWGSLDSSLKQNVTNYRPMNEDCYFTNQYIIDKNTGIDDCLEATDHLSTLFLLKIFFQVIEFDLLAIALCIIGWHKTKLIGQI